jgi:brefeldin A-inhibited guanine nucleotide-exchange protein
MFIYEQQQQHTNVFNRFCVQNSSVFPSPDTAFVLSFSIIMLNTDLHNPAIQDDRRMTKQGFRRQAEGIANGESLEDEYLDAIYDRIKTNPISLKEDDQLRGRSAAPVGGGIADLFSSAATVAGRRKLEAYSKEREDIVRESQLMFSQVKKSRANRIEYISMADLTDEHVRPMFEVAWGPILGVYVHLLDQVEDESIISLCLEGLRDCVRIAAVFDIPLVRDTMVNTLTKFTTLDTVRNEKHEYMRAYSKLIKIDT